MLEMKKWHMPRGTSVSEDEDGEFVLASDYDALAAECERLRAANIDCVDHFNQAMADLLELTAERDAALAELARVIAQRDAILQQARAWSCEAKTQRATVLEVGDILGGVPDWGPIAAGVEAMRAELAALKGGQDDAELADRMKAAGMLSVAERMAGQTLDVFMRHAGVHDLATFAQWLEMRRAECLKMHARFELEGRENDDELYEWVIAHAAVFSEVHINFKAAIEAPSAQASARVADAGAMADRFISWPLPASVRPDGCVMNPEYPHRYGTNLLTWAQAKAMFEYVLAAPTPGASDGKEDA